MSRFKKGKDFEERNRKIRNKALSWSLIIAFIGGVFGIVSLDVRPFATYFETPSPLLGQPISYQTIQNCNLGQESVCKPIANNNFGYAFSDYLICFFMAFAIAYVILIGLKRELSSTGKFWRRNRAPLFLLIFAILIVSVATSGGIVYGTSLSSPHIPAPNGVYVLPRNVTLYSGNATSATLKGTSRITLVLLNTYWTALDVSLSVSLIGANVTTNPVSIYQCPPSGPCLDASSISVPAYTALGLNTSSTQLYLGTEIVNGSYYECQVNIVGEGLTNSFNLQAV